MRIVGVVAEAWLRATARNSALILTTIASGVAPLASSSRAHSLTASSSAHIESDSVVTAQLSARSNSAAEAAENSKVGAEESLVSVDILH